MKKRILSLILAVITVLQVCAIAPLPIIAEDGTSSIPIEEMEVGKLYTAVWDYELLDFMPTKFVTDEYGDGGLVQYPTYLLKEFFPQELTVMKTEEEDFFLYVTNEDWGSEEALSSHPIDEYRYVESFELIVLAPVATATVTYKGKPADTITLHEGGSMPLRANAPEGISEKDVTWSWQILVGDRWVTINDRTKQICNISYALVVNVLDENDEAQVRTVAHVEDKEYPSSPVTVKMKYARKPIETEYENDKAEVASASLPTSYAASSSVRPLSDNSEVNPIAEGDVENIFTLTVNFVKVLPDGTQVRDEINSNIHVVQEGYEAYPVTLRPLLGYYPSMTAPSNPYDFTKNPEKDPSFTSYTMEAGKTADFTVTIYYYPGTADYKVYHYLQNIDNDQYPAKPSAVTEKNDTVDRPVPDGLAESFEGFQPLYYERTAVAVDGSTIIEIYYEREYFSVTFDLVHTGAYGQEDLYVKYECDVTLNPALCAGWTFDHWVVVDERGNEIANSPHLEKLPKLTVTDNVIFRAVWTGSKSSYKVLYWIENANDGNYSIAYQETFPETSGQYVTWNGVIPAEFIAKMGDEYQFFSLNSSETEEKNRTEIAPDQYVDGVIVEGDGSTNVNVYFNRKTYSISFLADKQGPVHDHTVGPCKFNPMYCTHVHSNTCTVSTHTHDSSCGAPTCGYSEHMHTDLCCDTHIHNLDCYSEAQPLSNLGEQMKTQIIEDISENHTLVQILQAVLGRWWDAEEWFKKQLNNSSGDPLTTATSNELNKIVTMAPPQNLQSGYIYVQNNAKIEFDFTYEDPTVFWGDKTKEDSYSGTVSYSAIYIDGEWCYYTGTATDKTIIEADACSLPDHDHTSGCTYGGTCSAEMQARASKEKHKHCALTEHVHNDNCYSCGKANGTCPHQHTADCYGNVCMVPSYEHYQDENANINGNYTVLRLQAKYGQDITEYLPYYIELYGYKLHQNTAGENFVGWKYAGTGWGQTNATLRYVKHVTMEEELCYSNGVTATAEYDASATNAYLLYYLFESFDQEDEVGAKDFDLSGGGRQKLGAKWYDSDPAHLQLVMWPSAGGTIPGGQKDILGMTFTDIAGNPMLGTLSLPIGTIETETLNAYFYDRNVPGVLTFNQTHQAANSELLQIPAAGQTNPLKYGVPLGEIAQMLKDSGMFDIENPPYPEGLEPGAYDFVGWYTTPYETDYTKVDWDTDTFPNSDLPLYAVWAPTRHTVYVYEDYTMTEDKLFTEDNGGIQLVPHGYRTEFVDYSQSSYADAGYTFNGWYYIDPKTNERTRFLLASMPVTQDMKIFAEWKMDARVPYRINFVHKHADGTEHAVADSIVGTALVGQSKTFRPYGGLELYADYQEGFFPEIGSHTLQMMYEEVKDENGNTVLDENGKPVLLVNEFTFYYMEIEKVNYTIHYVDEDGNSLHPSETLSTRYAAVTERFIPISGYTAEDYAISLIISATEPEKNVITFRYKENEKPTVDGFWFVNYIFVHADGTREKVQSEEGIEPFDPALDLNERPTFAGSVLDFTDEMFRFSGTVEAKTRALVEGELVDVVIPMSDLLTGTDDDGNKTYNYYVNEYGIELDFYYEPMNVGYDIVYKVADSDDEFARVSVDAEDSLPHGYAVDVTIDQQIHMNIVMNEGCQLIDPTKTTIKMYLDPDESRNEIVFLYQEFNATFDYIIVCDDLENSGVRLSHTTDDIPAGSDALPGTAGGLKKVYPYESSAYYFAGWFADQKCTIPLDESYPIILEQSPYDADGQKSMLTPTKTEVTYTVDGVEHTGSIYVSTEYYALFLPRSADLTVTVNGSEGDTFLLTLVGDEGSFAEGTTVTVAVVSGVPVTLTNMPIGTYTVTSNESWSWRYEKINTTATVATSVGGSVTISASIDDDRWLTDDAMGIVPTS